MLLGALLVFAAVGPARAQERPIPKLSQPPKGADFGGPPAERAEIRELLDNAHRLYDRAYRLREGAAALRDRNRYDDADAYEEQARDMEEQARGYERRAEEARLPTAKHRPSDSDD